MADDTSAADTAPRVVRVTPRFGTIVVVGGGCYGSYYVRQLGRAAHAGALAWDRAVVVDRDPGCMIVSSLGFGDAPALQVEIAEWSEYFAG